MPTFNYSDLLKNQHIWIGASFHFQSASKDLFQEFGKVVIKEYGVLIIKGRMDEKNNKNEIQFFLKLDKPEKYKNEKLRFEFKNDEQDDFRIADIDYFNGESIMSDVIDFDNTKSLLSGHLSWITR